MKRVLFVSIVVILAINLNAQQTGSFKDPRDGKIYKTVKIGNQVWMAENLAYKPSSDFYYVYDNNNSNLNKYGYLYGLSIVFSENICPTGWHVPNIDEWKELTDFVGSNDGLKLKSKSGWYNDSYNNDGNGTDDFGFSSLPSGVYDASSDDIFEEAGYNARYGSSTIKYGSVFFLSLSCGSNDTFISYIDLFEEEETEVGVSIRCVKDN